MVLLLDLTQLGELRVDVGVRDRRVNAVFTAVHPGTVHRLVVGLPQLRAAMAQAGLEVADLRVQPASGDRLPIADLTLRRRDDALVDVHA